MVVYRSAKKLLNGNENYINLKFASERDEFLFFLIL